MATCAAEDLQKLWEPQYSAVAVGWIVRLSESGQAVVDFRANKLGPVPARSTEQFDCLPESLAGMPVMLVFENGDPTLPIVVGRVRETLVSSNRPQQVGFPAPGPLNASVDGRSVTLEAAEEVVLRCGEASITLRKNGRVVVKGIDIVSRASRTNKIRGAAVSIN
jgi:hypothetical protein